MQQSHNDRECKEIKGVPKATIARENSGLGYKGVLIFLKHSFHPAYKLPFS